MSNVVAFMFMCYIVGVMALSAVLFDYNLYIYFDLDAPWYFDLLGGLIAPVNVFAAIVGYIFELNGHVAPIVQF